MKVLVFGGTHGNEWTGATVVTRYAEHFKRKYSKLDLNFILANPEAHRLNKRFKDEDLNRAFQFLHEDRKNSFEHHRARELKQLIDAEPCFVIDLHTTTSNMGQTLILSHLNKKNLSLAGVLLQGLPDCRIISSPDPDRKYLASQSDKGVMIEVGPIANGTLKARVLESTLTLLDKILSELQEPQGPQSGSLELFEEVHDVHYPLNEKGDLEGYIHHDLQGKDFLPLKGDYAAFRKFTGEEIHLKTNEELYPIFINEAAYYPHKLAFTLCQKIIKHY